eukprot:6174690-Pleurochrysis_carterae.AAC.2
MIAVSTVRNSQARRGVFAVAACLRQSLSVLVPAAYYTRAHLTCSSGVARTQASSCCGLRSCYQSAARRYLRTDSWSCEVRGGGVTCKSIHVQISTHLAACKPVYFSLVIRWRENSHMHMKLHVPKGVRMRVHGGLLLHASTTPQAFRSWLCASSTAASNLRRLFEVAYLRARCRSRKTPETGSGLA